MRERVCGSATEEHHRANYVWLSNGLGAAQTIKSVWEEVLELVVLWVWESGNCPRGAGGSCGVELPCFACSRISDYTENHTSSRMINKSIMRTWMSALYISCCGNRNSSVSIVTSPQAGRPGNRGSIPDRLKVYTSAPKRPDWLCPPLPPFILLFIGPWGICAGKTTGAWDLPHPYPVARLRVSGDIHGPLFVPSWHAFLVITQSCQFALLTHVLSLTNSMTVVEK